MKIRQKLTLAFILASLVPLVVLGIFSYNNYKESVTTQVLSHLQSVAVVQKHRVESILSQNQERLALVSSRTQLRISLDNYLKQGSIAEQERMNTILLDARASIRDFEEISVLDLDGEVVASTSEAAIGSSFADEEAFVLGRAGERGTTLLFLNEAGELNVYLSGPLYLEGELLGVVLIRSDADNILSVVSDYAGLGSTGETLLVARDEAGDVLFITPLRFDHQAALQLTVSPGELDSPGVQALLKNEGLFDNVIDYRGEPVLAATQYIEGVDWGLVVKIDLSETMAPVADLYRVTVLTIGLAAAFVVLISLYLAQSISKPIQELARVVDRIRGGDVSQRAEVTSGDEIGVLAQGVNEMTGELVGANAELRNVNRALRTISECNQILVRSTEESTLLREVCHVLINHGGYRWVWVASVDPGEPVRLHPVAEAWRGGGGSEAVRSGEEKDYTLAVEAVRAGEVRVLRNIPGNAGYDALRAEAERLGYASLIALPLVGGGLTIGVLNIYAAEPATFSEDEVKLLTELASDLAYGVTALRTRAEREQAEAKYSTLVERSNDGIIVIRDGLLSFVNTRMVELTGFSKEEALGRPFIDFVAPEYRELVADRYRKRLSGEEVPDIYEAEVLARGGRRIPVEINANLIEYEGESNNMVIIRDITQRKASEKALRDSEKRYRTVLDGMLEGCQIVDFNWRYLYLNDVAVEHARQPREALLGRTMMEVYPGIEDTEMFARLRQCMEKRLPVRAENLFTFPDGSQAWFALSIEPVPEGIFVLSLDITERKQAEEALRESEARYRSLVNNVKLGILRSTPGPSGRALAVNPALEEITGYSRKELLLLDMEKLYAHPKERLAFMKELASAKGAITRELCWRRKDGSEIVVLDRLIAVRDEGGDILYLDAIIEDITERKQAEEALGKSQARLAEAQRMAHIGNWELDLTSDTLIWSDEVYAIFGLKPRQFEATYEAFLDNIHPDDRDMVNKAYTESVKNKTPYSIVHRLLLKDGTVKYVEERGETFYEKGKPIRSIGTVQDITELKQAEEALVESEEKLRLIFESVADGITMTDLEGVIVRLNEAVVRLHGYDTKEELIGKRALSLISEADRAKAEENLKMTLEKGYSGTLEYTFLKKDGSEFPAELSATLLVDASGNPSGLVAITKNITERKKMQEQLILTDRLASIGELASGIAHELNNPLTAVTGFSELVLGKELPDDVREDIQTVYDESQRAARVVRNLLTFARKHAPVRQQMSVNNAIEKVLELRAYEQRVNNIKVVRELAPDLPEIKGDFFQLQQVFLNIVINAEYFMIETHKGGTLTITTERVKDMVRASFADDGPGIKKEHLQHIFDPFFTTKEVGRGTGLGLSICHGIVTEHGGRMYAESKYGEGATFIVELPIAFEGNEK
jgi:two-component system NtrC family sensor kinase